MERNPLPGEASLKRAGRLMEQGMAERFERHRQPWTSAEIQKLHTLAKKDMSLKAIAKAMMRSEESIRDRAKSDGLKIARRH